MNDGCIAEANVYRRHAVYALERVVQRALAPGSCLLRARLHIGFVDLHDVGTGAEQIADLLIHGGCGIHGPSKTQPSAPTPATCKSLVEVGGVLLRVLFLVAEGKIQPGPCCRESPGAVTGLVASKRNESALKRLIIEGVSVGSACHWLSPRRWFGLFGRKPH